MIHLPQITLVAIACNKYGETLRSLHKTLSRITPAKTILFTDTEIVAEGIECIKIDKLNWEQYNDFVVNELFQYIATSHVMIVQWDSWVLDETQWSDDFLKYDYIGAAWLDGVVGNGGGSIRTKRFQEFIAIDDFISITAPEDAALCRIYRTRLEEFGFKFAPKEVADRFSFELNAPVQPTFMFHAFHHHPFKPHILIKRLYALGDVISAEPLFRYFHNKGLQVVLDTNQSNMQIFFQHDYYIKHISDMDERITPERFIDLDGAYEKKPKQLVLKSYFEEAGIKDYTLQNAKLNYPIDQRNKLFRKYVVIHCDDTDMPHRNIRGVNWKKVRQWLEAKGYTVFQVGARNHEIVATYINTANSLQMLMYVIAGADLVIANDSGVGQMAVALGVPSVLFFGSVNPEYRYHDQKNIRIVQNYCKFQHCYHSAVKSEIGADCQINKTDPPCTFYLAEKVIDTIKTII
jgi:ADP-heptose:LPS heptosyltransferase